jgi:hypothetical protein
MFYSRTQATEFSSFLSYGGVSPLYFIIPFKLPNLNYVSHFCCSVEEKAERIVINAVFSLVDAIKISKKIKLKGIYCEIILGSILKESCSLCCDRQAFSCQIKCLRHNEDIAAGAVLCRRVYL